MYLALTGTHAGCCQVSLASSSIGSANFDKGLAVHGTLLRYWHFLLCGGGACVLARRRGSWIGTRALR